MELAKHSSSFALIVMLLFASFSKFSFRFMLNSWSGIWKVHIDKNNTVIAIFALLSFCDYTVISRLLMNYGFCILFKALCTVA